MSVALDYLRTSPLTWIFVTLLAYRAGVWLRDRTGGHPLAQPVFIAAGLVMALLAAVDVEYETYMEGGLLIHVLLGPATVALAVPLHRQAHHLKEMLVPLLVALPVGAIVSIGSAVLTVRALGGDRALELTVAPKSATTPVAIGIADQIGGVPALVAVFTMLAGLLGAVLGPGLLDRLRIRDHRARGLALGAVSHGVGTSRALHDHPTEGAFAGLSMGLTALLTSLLVPVVIALL
ncbi:LrgB family protein [Janibacter cremeus]|uniref:Putative murein hydrolase (TIGR00659 family) n=1 Tax=Janibacter cremeus TaxID=1285192 RepID=A0A852VV52_9MICO|nr:putative murein hydrolase (TIGR00659 family) [Janibacter cremeus]